MLVGEIRKNISYIGSKQANLSGNSCWKFILLTIYLLKMQLITVHLVHFVLDNSSAGVCYILGIRLVIMLGW